MLSDELSVYDTPLGRIGVVICYDLRFSDRRPEFYGSLVEETQAVEP